MQTIALQDGTIHTLPSDLRDSLLSDPAARAIWNTLTPLGRNEWICWVENAKLIETRQRRISRTNSELAESLRRPCCWPGCMHREKNTKRRAPSV